MKGDRVVKLFYAALWFRILALRDCHARLGEYDKRRATGATEDDQIYFRSALTLSKCVRRVSPWGSMLHIRTSFGLH